MNNKKATEGPPLFSLAVRRWNGGSNLLTLEQFAKSPPRAMARGTNDGHVSVSFSLRRTLNVSQTPGLLFLSKDPILDLDLGLRLKRFYRPD